MIFDLPQVPCSRLLAGRKLLELFCSEPAQVDVNHLDQQQDVDLVVQLDDQLLDVVVLVVAAFPVQSCRKYVRTIRNAVGRFSS